MQRYLKLTIMLSIVTILLLCGLAHAYSSSSKKVYAQNIVSVEFQFKPNTIKLHQSTYAIGKMVVCSIVWYVDWRFEHIVDARGLSKPVWVSGNVPYRDWIYVSSDPDLFGYPSWHYDSGYMWDILQPGQCKTLYLIARVTALKRGVWYGRCGADLWPKPFDVIFQNPWSTATVVVN